MNNFFNLRKFGGRTPLPPEDRFELSYIPEPNSGCWLWLGRECGSNGYGSISVNGRVIVAHRYSWELHKGPIPTGRLVCHHCDTPACVNPDHLFIGTYKDNCDDKIRKGRMGNVGTKTPLRGQDNGRAKLTGKDILVIRSTNQSQRKMAKKFNVSQSLIHKIKTRQMWRHI